MKKYFPLTLTTILMSLIQPAMAEGQSGSIASTISVDQLDQLFTSIGLPIALLMSFGIALSICFSSQLRFVQGKKQNKDWKLLIVASAASITACTLPSYFWGQFGLGNLILLALNCLLIAFGLALP